MRESALEGGNKSMFLGKLPLIGPLFGQDNNRNKLTEIVLTITAERIMRFDHPESGMSLDDQRLLRQGEGTESISLPDRNIGFGMIGLDRDRNEP